MRDRLPVDDGGRVQPWPRGLQARRAADYVGLALSTLLREVAEGRAPQPVQLTAGRKVWLLEELDDWLDTAADQRVAMVDSIDDDSRDPGLARRIREMHHGAGESAPSR